MQNDLDQEHIQSCPYAHDSYIPQESLPNYVLANLDSHENGLALLDEETKRSLTFADIKKQTFLTVEALRRKFNLGKGQHVAIALPNCLEYSAAILAVTLCGATAVLVNPGYTQREMLHVYNLTKPKLWIISNDVLPKLNEIIQLADRPNVITIESEECFTCWEHCSLQDVRDLQRPEINVKEDSALILFSSGTTGLPKGVQLTHWNLVASLRQHQEFRKQFTEDPNGKAILLLPMSHAFGVIALFASLMIPTVGILFSKFSLPKMLQTVQDYQISKLHLVPSIVVALAKLPVESSYDLSHLRVIYCGGAPLSDNIVETIHKKLNCTLLEGYGMTEATIRTHSNMPHNQRPGSVGLVLPFCQAKIVDPDSKKSLGPHQVGEIWVRGATIMKGYIHDEASTRETVDAQGWLHTGDIGYYDQDGYFYIQDRMKELIKYKGHQVPPSELEHILLTNPEIVEAAVVGIPDEDAGELPRAYVVKRPASRITEKEIVNFVAGQVSTHKQLRGGVVFLQDIPKTQSGKILRRELKKIRSHL